MCTNQWILQQELIMNKVTKSSTRVKFGKIYERKAEGALVLRKMVAKGQVEYLKTWWEPLLTSTPLKPISKKKNFANSNNESQEQVVTTSNSRCNFKTVNSVQSKQNAKQKTDKCKKVKKKSSVLYFDISSSSDEDNNDKSNSTSGIKINFDNIAQVKAIVKNKTLLTGNCNVPNQNKILDKLSNANGNLYQNEHLNNKNSLNGSKKNLNAASNELSLKSKCNVNPSKIEGGFRENVKKNMDEDNNNKENHEPKLISNNLKNPEKNVKNKLPVNSNLVKSVSYEKPDKVDGLKSASKCDSKRSSSYQLFSDSKEKELIDSLNLTNDADFQRNNITVPCKQRCKQMPTVKSTSVKQKKVLKSMVCDENKQKRPLRRRQSPREFWLPVSELSNINKLHNISLKNQKCSKRTSKIPVFQTKPHLKKCEEVVLKDTKIVEAKVLKKKSDDDSETFNTNVEQVQKCDNSSVNQKTTQMKKEFNNTENCEKKIPKLKGETEINNIELENKQKKGKKRLLPDKIIEKRVEEKKKTEGNITRKVKKIDNIATTKKITKDCVLQNGIPDVFKHLNELTEFVECKPGYLTKDCWSFKNYKCGIIKIKKEQTLCSRTKCENTYVGGVLINGNLRVKIGDTETELKEGGMICVPPLTDWSLRNIHNSESTFYFWCGRFRS